MSLFWDMTPNHWVIWSRRFGKKKKPIVPSSSRFGCSRNLHEPFGPWRWSHTRLLKFRGRLPSDAASHPGRAEFSAALERKPGDRHGIQYLRNIFFSLTAGWTAMANEDKQQFKKRGTSQLSGRRLSDIQPTLRVKLFLCMQLWFIGEWKCSRMFLTSVLDGSELSTSCPGRITSGVTSTEQAAWWNSQSVKGFGRDKPLPNAENRTVNPRTSSQ